MFAPPVSGNPRGCGELGPRCGWRSHLASALVLWRFALAPRL